jgi:hypothetical protein
MSIPEFLIKAVNCDLISGLLTNVCLGGIVSLQYADDTILFVENNFGKAKNFKWLLACFENMSSTRELIMINVTL